MYQTLLVWGDRIVKREFAEIPFLANVKEKMFESKVAE